jgi:hypothetical protein
MQGETWGMDASEHLDALLRHGMDGLLDVMVVHNDEPLQEATFSGAATASFARITGTLLDTTSTSSQDPNGDVQLGRLAASSNIIRRLQINASIRKSIESHGVRLIERKLVDDLRPTWHDVPVLAQTLKEILERCPSLRRSKMSSHA